MPRYRQRIPCILTCAGSSFIDLDLDVDVDIDIDRHSPYLSYYLSEEGTKGPRVVLPD